MNANVIALIQARGGSKGVPGKNLRQLCGHPVLAWSVGAALLAKRIDRTVLSTDSDEIAEVGRRYGAEVPFMRPAEFASDTATDLMVIRHALEWFRDNERHVPEYIVQIRPTTPLRDPAILDAAVAALQANPRATGLRSVYEMSESAWKTFEIDEAGFLVPLISKVRGGGMESANLPRQAFPPTYFGQGYVDIVRSNVVLGGGVTYGDKVMSFVTPDVGEIDSEEDFEKLEFFAKKYAHSVRDYLDSNAAGTGR